MQVQVLRLQNVYGWPRWPYVNGAVGGSDARRGRIRRGKDVVNAELDLRFRFPLRGGVWDEGLAVPGARPQPLGVQRAEGGVRFEAASCGPVLITLRRVEGGLPRVPETDFHIPPAPATPKVAVFKEVEHGFTAGGKSPEVPLSLLVALCSWNLWGNGTVPLR